MYLKNLTITNFKNLKELKLDFSPKINCISGNNGSGKTNLLDSVYYLSVTKSYFVGHDHSVINHNCDFTTLNGEYIREDFSEEHVSVSIARSGEKQIKRNSKLYQRLSDHLGLIPVVMVSPSDNALINDSGEERRRFLNSILSQVDREYLRKLQNYNQLLAQRNKLLKYPDVQKDLLLIVSEQMGTVAKYIYTKRLEFCKELLPVASDYYKKLSGGKESISVEYKSDLKEASLLDVFEENYEKDRLMKYTTAGIQRDDVLFTMEGYLIRRFGSQGQQKTFLLALKLAQFEIMAQIYGKPPILLLDDVFDKLDMQRVEYLLNLVASESFGQIFITDSNKVRIHSILEKVDGESRSFEIENGILL